MRKGFTLIELLVVVLIIGILSSIALPQYTNAVEKARTSEALSMIGSLKTGIDSYIMANGYPNIAVKFVGKSNTALDVDVEASLDCSAGKDVCEGKHFTYDAFCGSICLISVRRGTIEDYEGNNYKYELSIRKDTNGWTWTCYSYSKIGNHICKNLQAQGWRAGLYSE